MTGFEYQDTEEVYEGLERWLKKRRDEWQGEDRKYTGPGPYHVVDSLLDEVREAGVEGFLPWQR